MDIEKIKIKLLAKYAPFGVIIANTNFIEDVNTLSNGIPTWGTDGKDIYYHPDATKDMNIDEQVRLCAHEIIHIAFEHAKRGIGKDSEIWNIAADAVTNEYLEKDGFKINKKENVYIEGASNYTVEELYDILMEKKNKEQFQNNNTYKDIVSKTHNKWDNAMDQLKQDSNNTNNEEKTNLDNKETNKKQEIEKFTKLGEKEFFKQNKMDRKKRLEQLKDELSKEMLSAGKGSNSNTFTISDIGSKDSLIDWRILLTQIAKCDMDWSYKNATIEDGVVTSHLEEITGAETEILLDTSGSVSETLLKNFLRECKSILQFSKVKAGCFDDKFYGFTEITREIDIDNMQFIGRGGTDFNIAVNAFSETVENKIIFTDGYAPMPDTDMNIIWIVFGNNKINPKTGKVIYISNEQLNELINRQNIEYSRRTR